MRKNKNPRNTARFLAVGVNVNLFEERMGSGVVMADF
jgi:hypothetical protein